MPSDCEDQGAPKAKRAIGQVIEELGYGPAQIWTAALVNGSWLADGAEALAVTAVTSALAGRGNTTALGQWALGESAQASLVSVLYLGTLIGSLAAGVLGDMFGRRRALLLCYPFIVVFSIVSGCAQVFAVLLTLRFFVGFGFGLGQPNAVAMLVEITPARWRVWNQGFAQCAFALGELFCCLILWCDDPTMQNTRWRFVLIANAIPAAMLGVVSWLFLRESPVFLAQRSPIQAREVLEDMRRQNNKPEVSLEFSNVDADTLREPPSWWKQLGTIARPDLLWTTMLLCFIMFVYNLTVYGAFFAFPQLLPSLNVGMSPVATLTVGALVEIPFNFAGILIGFWTSRKTALTIYFVGLIASASLFAVSTGGAGGSPVLVQLGYYGLKGFPQIGSVSLFVLAAEAYPVAARATGTAAVLGCGRIGALLSSFVFEWVRAASGSAGAFFWLIVGLNVASLAALALLPRTTADSSTTTLIDANVQLIDANVQYGSLK